MSTNGQLETAVRTVIVNDILGGKGAETLTNTTELVESGIVDSINVLKLVDFIEEQYDIELEPEDIGEFTTISKIVGVVEAKVGLPN